MESMKAQFEERASALLERMGALGAKQEELLDAQGALGSELALVGGKVTMVSEQVGFSNHAILLLCGALSEMAKRVGISNGRYVKELEHLSRTVHALPSAPGTPSAAALSALPAGAAGMVSGARAARGVRAGRAGGRAGIVWASAAGGAAAQAKARQQSAEMRRLSCVLTGNACWHTHTRWCAHALFVAGCWPLCHAQQQRRSSGRRRQQRWRRRAAAAWVHQPLWRPQPLHARRHSGPQQQRAERSKQRGSRPAQQGGGGGGLVAGRCQQRARAGARRRPVGRPVTLRRTPRGAVWRVWAQDAAASGSRARTHTPVARSFCVL
jgi:hypothetical protein